MDGLLNFYLETSFDVDAVFGTQVCTAENGDWLNVYANYDMASGQVCDKLEIARPPGGRQRNSPLLSPQRRGKGSPAAEDGGLLPGADGHGPCGTTAPRSVADGATPTGPAM